MERESKIIHIWEEYGEEWIKLIQGNKIPSRKVTNSAIVDTVLKYPFEKICDIGCGEGWLVRELRKNGKIANGVDATKKLLDFANRHKIGSVYQQTFEEIIKGKPLAFHPYDAVVLNFCLYGNELTTKLLEAIAQQLIGNQLIFIQTLHPFSILKLNKPYQNQWLEDSWKGLDGSFSSTHAWYYRTFSGWYSVFKHISLKVVEIVEPTLDSGIPLSIIFVLKS